MRAEIASDHLSDQMALWSDRSVGDPTDSMRETDRSEGDPSPCEDRSVSAALVERLTDHPDRGSLGRIVRLRRHHCGAHVLVGLDSDRCAFTATVEPYALHPRGEVEALRQHRRTYRLRWGSLDRRDRWSIPGALPSHELIILAEHRCGAPIPDPWRLPPAPPAPTRTLEVVF